MKFLVHHEVYNQQVMIKKELLSALGFFIAIYAIICWHLYMSQEGMIFFPQKLNKSYKFNFDQNFDEIKVKMKDGITIDGILFKANNSRGLVFYLHGNAGSIDVWGKVAKTYNDLNYDVFLLDYRGYGKSDGQINGERGLFEDIQTAYDEMKKRYSEDKIVVLGYSIGTGLAAKLASINKPHLLILQAPYYSLTDLMAKSYPIIPTFILKYKFETNIYIKKCKMPVVIFHGDKDEVIYYESSLRLKESFKKYDRLIILNGQKHNDMTENKDYKKEIQRILNP